jgi:hypothetical protein
MSHFSDSLQYRKTPNITIRLKRVNWIEINPRNPRRIRNCDHGLPARVGPQNQSSKKFVKSVRFVAKLPNPIQKLKKATAAS